MSGLDETEVRRIRRIWVAMTMAAGGGGTVIVWLAGRYQMLGREFANCSVLFALALYVIAAILRYQTMLPAGRQLLDGAKHQSGNPRLRIILLIAIGVLGLQALKFGSDPVGIFPIAAPAFIALGVGAVMLGIGHMYPAKP